MNWDDALGMLDGKVAEIFDVETFHVYPTVRGSSVNSNRVADPGRIGFDFKGSIDLGPTPLAPGFSHPATLTVASHERGRESPSHEAVITALSTDWPHPIKVEDQIGWKGARYVVAAIPDDGGGRKAIYVNRTKVAP